MIARIRKSMQEKDQGFTLIELLVVMIIIGILAAIAIPVFLNQRKKAAETSAKSDATNIAQEVAAAYVDGTPSVLTLTAGDNSTGSQTISATLTVGTETTPVKVGVGNNATMTVDLTAASPKYCVTVTPHQSGAQPWSAGPNGLAKGSNACP